MPKQLRCPSHKNRYQKEVGKMAIKEREPMGAHIAFSAAQLDRLGVPEGMTEDELSECVDRALLADDTALHEEIQQWIEDMQIEQQEQRNALV